MSNNIFKTDDIKWTSKMKSKYVKLFMNIIKSMSFVDNTAFELSKKGLKYIVEESKSFQTTAFIEDAFFEEYTFTAAKNGTDVAYFSVDMKTVTEFLNAFMDNDLSHMKIIYYGESNTLSFSIVQEDKITDSDEDSDNDTAGEIETEYIIKTRNTNDIVDFNIVNHNLASSIILHTVDFFNVIHNFDRTVNALQFNITQKGMVIKSYGILQFETEIMLARMSDIFVTYTLNSPSHFSYSFQYFKAMQKTLNLASMISLDTHIDGLLRIKLLVKINDEDIPLYIEYFCIPNLEDDE